MRPADEPDEFEALLEPHGALVHGFALKLTGNRPDADDVVQESLYRALRGFHGFQRGTNFRAWLMRIVTNTFLQRRERERRRFSRAIDEQALPDPHQNEAGLDPRALLAFGWETFADRLDEGMKFALEELPDQFRLPILLSSLAGLSHQDIATALHIPVGTVMSRLFRARKRLKASLQAYEEHGRGATTRGQPS